MNWESLQNSDSLKADLLTVLRQEKSDLVRKKLCEIVCQLLHLCSSENDNFCRGKLLYNVAAERSTECGVLKITTLAGNTGWPEITEFLFNCCDVNFPHLFECALNIIR